jgi:hypothetical protein
MLPWGLCFLVVLQLDPFDEHLLDPIEQSEFFAAPRAILRAVARVFALVKGMLTGLAYPHLLDPLDL